MQLLFAAGMIPPSTRRRGQECGAAAAGRIRTRHTFLRRKSEFFRWRSWILLWGYLLLLSFLTMFTYFSFLGNFLHELNIVHRGDMTSLVGQRTVKDRRVFGVADEQITDHRNYNNYVDNYMNNNSNDVVDDFDSRKKYIDIWKKPKSKDYYNCMNRSEKEKVNETATNGYLLVHSNGPRRSYNKAPGH